MNKSVLIPFAIGLLLLAAFGVLSVYGSLNLATYEDSVPSAVTPIPPGTRQEPWYLIAVADEDEAALMGADKRWVAANVGATVMKVPNASNSWTIAFIAYGDGDGAGDPENGSFKYELYACRERGSLEWVCSGNPSVGAVQVSCLPHDESVTAVLSTDYKHVEGSPSLVTSSGWDSMVGFTKVADQIGKISVDGLGARYVRVRIFDRVNVTRVYAYLTVR
jgi:hypothetical protein